MEQNFRPVNPNCAWDKLILCAGEKGVERAEVERLRWTGEKTKRWFSVSVWEVLAPKRFLMHFLGAEIEKQLLKDHF